MTRDDWRGLVQGFLKFVAEEASEPEHAGDAAPTVTSPNSAVGAGVMLIDPARHVLFVRRSNKVDHPGSWCFPGGGLEAGETPAECAARETREETGHDCALDQMRTLDQRQLPGGPDYTTYCELCDQFRPKLTDEHTAFAWVPWGDWPQPLHPGVQATLEGMQQQLDDLEGAEDVDLKRNADGSYQPVADLGEILPFTTKVLREDGQPYDGSAPGKRTGNEAADAEMAMDPLTEKGRKILGSMKEQYGAEKGEQVFYASKNKGTISGVDADLSERFELTADLTHLRDKMTGRLYPASALASDSTWKGPRFVSDGQRGMALDRSSVRAYDNDGRLHVDNAHISKATVNPYYGREIPDYERLGLRPDRKYMLLRDPEELQSAAKTFNNLPVLNRHVPVTAETPDSHQPEQVIGSTGTDARYKHPYMDNSLVLWAKSAIDDVEDDIRCELSCAYRYDADMTPGTYEGQHYDGVMRNIRGNHVALVKDGRAGHDVVIGDEAPRACWPSSRWAGATNVSGDVWSDRRFAPVTAQDAAPTPGYKDIRQSAAAKDEWSDAAREAAAAARVGKSRLKADRVRTPSTVRAAKANRRLGPARVSATVKPRRPAKDAGTHEGAVKAAATRAAHSGGAAAGPVHPEIHGVATQHGWEHSNYTTKSGAERTRYSHPKLPGHVAVSKGGSWHHDPKGGLRNASGRGAKSLKAHLADYHGPNTGGLNKMHLGR